MLCKMPNFLVLLNFDVWYLSVVAHNSTKLSFARNSFISVKELSFDVLNIIHRPFKFLLKIVMQSIYVKGNREKLFKHTKNTGKLIWDKSPAICQDFSYCYNQFHLMMQVYSNIPYTLRPFFHL
jgi:hypothetical protein